MTLRPKYLDAAGLVALWRELLLAQKVLRGEINGYKHHPQLSRFRDVPRSIGVIAAYLAVVHDEAVRRDYQFDVTKISRARNAGTIEATEGQLLYEWRHLREKLKRRAPERYNEFRSVAVPLPHRLFRIVACDVQEWERMPKSRQE